MKKVTYILSNIDKAQAFEWIVKAFEHKSIKLCFILLHEKEPFLFTWLRDRDIECYYIKHTGKKSYISTFIQTFKLLRLIKPQVVHTHLFDANLIGLFAAWILRIKKRIYTRHHATFHHEYFPNAVKWDRLSNFLATDIVAISENVKQVLRHKENVPLAKVHLIHHGFDLGAFQHVDEIEIENLKNKYGVTSQHYPVVGVVSRYTRLKGIQYIIPAFKKLLQHYPYALLILANANGQDKKYIQKCLSEQIHPENYIEIPFERNLFALYKMFHFFVHVPINKEIEAFGQTYVEALAAGIPSVFTLSGVAREFVQHKYNALTVDYTNAEQIYNSLLLLLNDKELCQHLQKNGFESLHLLTLEVFIDKLEKLYA